MGLVSDYEYGQIVDDPDDYRPNTTYAAVLDQPLPGHEPVRGFSLFFERCAPGDRIPLHSHPHEEAIVIDGGEAKVTVGEVTG